ncbi:AraC family transcriptional regulator [Acidobacteria bacterium AB60]|nr:AraC family transcriptional regulator [Acidobacteria bacterium AB60]
MQVMQLAGPAPRLASYIRLYAHLAGQLGNASLVHPVPARATPLLEFQFGDTNQVHWCERPLVEASQRVQVIGLQTHRRVRLHFTGKIETFMIFFQPTGLNLLFSLPMHELTNTNNEARAVLGSGIDELADRLANGRTFEERMSIANNFFLRRCAALPSPDRLTSAALSILRRRGRIQAPALAQQACMSPRQFERRFTREVGIPPKLYARIARFESALESKALSADESWTDITNRLGYFDQTHLIKDFKEFSGEIPTSLLAQLESSYRAHLDEIRSGRRPTAPHGAPQLIL